MHALKIIDRILIYEYITTNMYSPSMLFMQSHGKQLHIIFMEQFRTTLINIKHIFQLHCFMRLLL